jgi:hypothetical protein
VRNLVYGINLRKNGWVKVGVINTPWTNHLVTIVGIIGKKKKKKKKKTINR